MTARTLLPLLAAAAAVVQPAQALADPVVAGAPGFDAGGAPSAGGYAVFTRDGSAFRGTFTRLDAPAASDRFGAAVARGDFDGDGRGDLAVSAPGRTVEGRTATGAVLVRYAAGTTATINGPVAAGEPMGARFGEALAAGDLDGDGADDLAVGAVADAPTTSDVEDDGTGAVHLLFGGAGGISAEGARVLQRPRPDDVFFGSVLALGDVDRDGHLDLVEAESGSPDASDGDERAGHLSYCAGSPTGPEACVAVGERSGPGPDSLAIGDVTGDRHREVIAGSAFDRFDVEDSPAPAGAVRLYPGTADGPSAERRTVTERTRRVPGRAEQRDRFGQAVAYAKGRRVIVGVPGEDVQRGSVIVLRFATSGKVRGGRRIDQATKRVPGTRRSGDVFGEAVAVVDGDLVVGAPGERQGAGTITVLRGLSAKGSRSLTLEDAGADVPAPDENDLGPRLGSVLSAR